MTESNHLLWVCVVCDIGKGMAGRCVQGVINDLKGNYGANPANMPHVVNKGAFR
jgi:hypothetical protein